MELYKNYVPVNPDSIGRATTIRLTLDAKRYDLGVWGVTSSIESYFDSVFLTQHEC